MNASCSPPPSFPQLCRDPPIPKALQCTSLPPSVLVAVPPVLGWMPWLPSSVFAPAYPVHQPAHLFVPQGSAAPTPGSSPP